MRVLAARTLVLVRYRSLRTVLLYVFCSRDRNELLNMVPTFSLFILLIMVEPPLSGVVPLEGSIIQTSTSTPRIDQIDHDVGHLHLGQIR